jgi:SAM-dependent methyltransferase
MVYNKITYWSARRDPNNDLCRTFTHLHEKLVSPFLGKNLNVQDGVSFYDITNTYKDRLLKKCEQNDLLIKKFIVDETGVITTPFEDTEFDVVCSFEVLLHSPPNEIENLMQELCRIGKKVFVITWYKNGDESNSSHCWTRDYKKIINNNNFKLLHWDDKTINNQVFFIYSK